MSESNCVLRLTLKKCFKAFNLENDTRPGNELLTDRHRAAARWLPTTGLVKVMIFLAVYEGV